MQETTTRVPEVVDALVARMTTALAGVADVVDGPMAAQVAGDVALCIGWSGEDGELAVSSTITRSDGYGHRYTEQFGIACDIVAVSGDVDMKAVRDKVKDVFDLVWGAVKQDRGLGGSCDLASIGPDAQWRQAQTADGAVCDLSFVVSGKAAL